MHRVDHLYKQLQCVRAMIGNEHLMISVTALAGAINPQNLTAQSLSSFHSEEGKHVSAKILPFATLIQHEHPPDHESLEN